MQVPSRAELARFFDEEQAPAVHFVETVASWPSLRILEYLYGNEPASTGDVARGLNMDMRDVKDRLDALAEHDVVEEEPDGWVSTTDRVTMTIQRGDGLEVGYETVAGDRAVPPETAPDDAEQPPGGVLARVRRAVSSLFR